MRQCSRCDYDLTGLPDEHTCPECGFAYDKHATSIRLTSRREYRYAQIMGVLWFFYFVSLWQRGPIKMPAWFLIVFSVIFVGMFLFRLRKSRTVADRMIFTREGFTFYSPTTSSTPVPWSVVKSASCSWWDGALRIQRTDDFEPISISHRHLGGVKIGKKCAAELNRLKLVYNELSS